MALTPFSTSSLEAERQGQAARHLGADEIHRGKAQKFYTVLSDLVRGEVIGLAKDRSAASLAGLVTTCLDARQRAAVEAVCTDMPQPYLNAVSTGLKQAEIVFDKFHVRQHASGALDEVRRQEFFRAGAVSAPMGAESVGCCCGGGTRSADPNAASLSNYSRSTVACSRPTCFGSNWIDSGPTRLVTAWPAFSSAG
jgi:hypothetical protein